MEFNANLYKDSCVINCEHGVYKRKHAAGCLKNIQCIVGNVGSCVFGARYYGVGYVILCCTDLDLSFSPSVFGESRFVGDYRILHV